MNVHDPARRGRGVQNEGGGRGGRGESPHRISRRVFGVVPSERPCELERRRTSGRYFAPSGAVDRGDQAIVEATVRLGQSFGLDVIAEGVESTTVVDELLDLGCERAQGFLLCRPKPAAELDAILRHGRVDPATFRRPRPVAA